MITEWSMLSSWATSHVVLREAVLMILSTGHCQLAMAGHCTVMNHHCTVNSLTVPGPGLWLADVASYLCSFMTHFEL